MDNPLLKVSTRAWNLNSPRYAASSRINQLPSTTYAHEVQSNEEEDSPRLSRNGIAALANVKTANHEN